MKKLLMMLLCLGFIGCATAPKGPTPEEQISQLQETLSQKEEQIEALQVQLKEKDAKIAELKKSLENFGVFKLEQEKKKAEIEQLKQETEQPIK